MRARLLHVTYSVDFAMAHNYSAIFWLNFVQYVQLVIKLYSCGTLNLLTCTCLLIIHHIFCVPASVCTIKFCCCNACKLPSSYRYYCKTCMATHGVLTAFNPAKEDFTSSYVERLHHYFVASDVKEDKNGQSFCLHAVRLIQTPALQ